MLQEVAYAQGNVFSLANRITNLTRLDVVPTRAMSENCGCFAMRKKSRWRKKKSLPDVAVEERTRATTEERRMVRE